MDTDEALTIETLFLDASTGETLGQAYMPVEQLPQNFALETTMYIEDEDWKVIKAEPMTAEEYLQTGKLVLTLRKIIKIPIEKIFFTLPIICDEIPAIRAGSTKHGKNIVELHEDNWRQIEFASQACRDTIEAEFAKIRRIYQEASFNNEHFLAFKKLHVRQQPDFPLHHEKILLSQLTLFFTSDLYMYEGISYERTDGLIEDGFAFRVANVLFYGQEVGGIVKYLGIAIGGKYVDGNKNVIQSIQKLMETHKLYLVDWCRTQLLSANIEELPRFLGS